MLNNFPFLIRITFRVKTFFNKTLVKFGTGFLLICTELLQFLIHKFDSFLDFDGNGSISSIILKISGQSSLGGLGGENDRVLGVEDKRPPIENNLSDGILVLGMQNRSNANFGN